jgi:hypothetical protein
MRLQTGCVENVLIAGHALSSNRLIDYFLMQSQTQGFKLPQIHLSKQQTRIFKSRGQPSFKTFNFWSPSFKFFLKRSNIVNPFSRLGYVSRVTNRHF